MNLKTYQEHSKRTCPSLGSDKLDLAHMVLGMCSELSELTDAHRKQDDINISEESADIVWYLSNYCTFRKLNLDHIIHNTVCEINEGFDYYIYELTDLVKKYIAYNKAIDVTREIILIKSIYTGLVNDLVDGSYTKVITIEQALQNNIDKLKIRYPDKFSEENAINRKLDLELIELSK